MRMIDLQKENKMYKNYKNIQINTNVLYIGYMIKIQDIILAKLEKSFTFAFQVKLNELIGILRKKHNSGRYKRGERNL